MKKIRLQVVETTIQDPIDLQLDVIQWMHVITDDSHFPLADVFINKDGNIVIECRKGHELKVIN